MNHLKDYLQELQKINKLVLQIRKNTPINFVNDWTKPADLLIKKEYLNNKEVDVLNITLTPTGCEWAKTGGCTMCGEWSGSSLGKKIDAKYHIAQFASTIVNELPKYNSPWIRIYQEGSYLNSKEIDQSAQKTILGLASLLKGIKRVTIESLAKVINENLAKTLKESVYNNVELEIAIGFEAQDDIIRLVCINKGELIDHFKKALIILKKYKIKSLAYVLLKPPFLTEYEAIEEAVKTINKAFDIGFDAVSLEPVSIHEWSLVEALYFNHLYETPWLWSIIEVIKRINRVCDLRIGGIEYYPRPDIIAHNKHLDSHNCTSKVWELIRHYNSTRNKQYLNNIGCTCKSSWEKELHNNSLSLKERINKYIDSVSIEKYLKYKRKDFNNI